MGAGISLIVWGILSIETEHVVEQPAVILAKQRSPMYSVVSGDVEEVFVEDGDWVKKGDPILRLKNSSMLDKLDELMVERDIIEMSIDRARQFQRLNEVAVLSVKRKQIGDRVAYLNQRVEDLVVRAPSAGRVQSSSRFSTMLGLYVEPGVRIGEVIGTGDLEAVVVVPQEDAGLIEEGMKTRARFWGSAWQEHEGVVSRVSRQFVKEMPHDALSGFFGGEVDTMARGDYKTSPYTPSVLAYVQLNQDDESILIDGMTGRVKVVLGESSLGSQQWRLLLQSFSLDWRL